MAFQISGTTVFTDTRNIANIANEAAWVDARLVEVIDDASFSPDGRVGTYAMLGGRTANWTFGAQGIGTVMTSAVFVDANLSVSDNVFDSANVSAIGLETNVRSGSWMILGRIADPAANDKTVTFCLRVA